VSNLTCVLNTRVQFDTCIKYTCPFWTAVQLDTCQIGHVSTVTGTVDTRQNACIFVVNCEGNGNFKFLCVPLFCTLREYEIASKLSFIRLCFMKWKQFKP